MARSCTEIRLIGRRELAISDLSSESIAADFKHVKCYISPYLIVASCPFQSKELKHVATGAMQQKRMVLLPWR